MGSLDGKVALVTGGSRGIGAAIVGRLAAEGAAVAFTYNASPDRAKEVVRGVEEAGGKAIAIQADATDPQAVTSAVDQAAAELGGLDILVNNAGIFPYGSIEELTLDDYENTMAIHVRAVFVAVKAAVRHMGEGGRIISIGSSLVERVPGPGISLYSMSKSSLVGFTKGLARDLGPRGITATVVHPGSTDTEMNPADSEEAEAERAVTALGRYGTTADIAATVAHLAGPAGAYITGTSITVDGGVTA
ncbi:SDR family NAD(P)-dependent oxidoreductase [Marinactinospora thermotolerans]|uniref:NAD(P)-dependent dehydrogenase, short-chain alcohol dehydrogenase family n=1 Tax=Marinactinospora thermotolerans DSM 45154 TaxID=1122192 RepID=A0A1T4R993_9ACTN|nr:SDR family oxidoreductase [Marinactinospora thermotolerans]SKA12487.1 NAD(P)-dependent dehydrogenase, short-chain alcohol dehydrogenase family [Marinactinospora thermotolerans DSM 45154]